MLCNEVRKADEEAGPGRGSLGQGSSKRKKLYNVQKRLQTHALRSRVRQEKHTEIPARSLDLRRPDPKKAAHLAVSGASVLR